MNKQLWLIGTLTALIILIPSSLIAFALANFFGHYGTWFALSAALIFIIGLISNTMIQKKINKDILNLQNRLAEISNLQNVEVSCSYCKTRNIVPVFLNQRNTFDCKNCKQVNLIIFQFATAQITVPLELPKLGDKINERKPESN
jgi:hypothetical protein